MQDNAASVNRTLKTKLKGWQQRQQPQVNKDTAQKEGQQTAKLEAAVWKCQAENNMEAVKMVQVNTLFCLTVLIPYCGYSKARRKPRHL